MLSTYNENNTPMIVDFEGKFRDFIWWLIPSLGNINEDLAFEYGDSTEARYGCGVTFQDEFWYFGGTSYRRQVNLFQHEDDS